MINCIQIQRIAFPALFLFDSVKLAAKFVSTSVHLLTLTFKAQQYLKQRSELANIQLKIPSARTCFTLILEVKIVNMSIQPVEIAVDLALFDDCNQLQLVFQTQVGMVSAYVNIIEEIYLPKQPNITQNHENSSLQNNEIASGQQASSSIEQYKDMNKSSLNESMNQIERIAVTEDKQKTMSKRNYSSRIKSVKKSQKMSLSRSQYMKIELEQSLLNSDHANAQTQSQIKCKKNNAPK